MISTKHFFPVELHAVMLLIRNIIKIKFLFNAIIPPMIIFSANNCLADDLYKAIKLNNEAVQLYDKGKFNESARLMSQSLAIKKSKYGPDHSELYLGYRNLGDTYNRIGRYLEAKEMLMNALNILNRDKNSRKHEIADVMQAIAQVFSNLGDQSESEKYAKQSVIIYEQMVGATDPSTGVAIMVLGSAIHSQGRLIEAAKLYERAKSIFEHHMNKSKLYFVQSIAHLAKIHSQQNNDLQAIDEYNKYISLMEEIRGRSHPEVASGLQALAQTLIKLKRYNEADNALDRAIDIDTHAFGENNIQLSFIIETKVGGLIAQDKYNNAEQLISRAIEIRQKTFEFSANKEALGHLFNLLAYINMKQGRIKEALDKIYLSQSYGSARAEPALTVIDLAAKQGIIDNKKSLQDSYLIIQQVLSSRAADAISQVNQRFSAGSGELAKIVRQDQDFLAEIRKLDKALIAEVSKATSERSAILEKELAIKMSSINSNRDKLREILSAKYPEYITLSKPKPLSIEETQHLLDVDEAVIVIASAKEEIFAWVVTDTKAYWISISQSKIELNNKIFGLRRTLTFDSNNSDSNNEYNTKIAYELYKLIFSPLKNMIVGKKRLSVITTGALTSLPLGLLITSDPRGKGYKSIDWLIKDYAITVIPSIYSLKTMRKHIGDNTSLKPIIAFADPIFSSNFNNDEKTTSNDLRSLPSYYEGSVININKLSNILKPLPGTRQEVEEVGKALNADSLDIKLGRDASETTVKSSPLHQYRVIYFATHGLVAGEIEKYLATRSEPSLALTIPSRASSYDDGLLQASEVAQLKLNADWAVLSACNTAASDGVGAEALSGLARAFLYAGARSLVVSNWDISDEATAILMADLFSISTKNPGLTHGEALQKAMINMINNSPNDNDAHPRIWAPFIIVGEPAKNNKSSFGN